MKKLIAALSLLALVGAGCAKADVSNKTTAKTSQPQVEVTTSEESNGTLKQTQSGTDENGVPIIDVVLGDDAKTETKTDTKTEAKTETQVAVAIDVKMEAGNFFFSPKTIETKAGQTVNITFSKNVGFHTFVIDDTKTKATVSENGKVSFTAPSKPGTYAFYCDVGSHRANGMEGTLIVK